MYLDDGYYLSPEEELALRLFTHLRIRIVEQKAIRRLAKSLLKEALGREPTEEEIAAKAAELRAVFDAYP